MATIRAGVPPAAQVNKRPSGRYKSSDVRVGKYADAVERHGAPAFAAAVRGLPELDRWTLVQSVADELRARGRPGKAGQVLVYLVST